VGQTPAQALADPDLPFNLTIARAAEAARQMKLRLLYQRITKDEFGISHILNTLKLLYEDP
jgi:hypothetical protein